MMAKSNGREWRDIEGREEGKIKGFLLLGGKFLSGLHLSS
jgi:hypothetical protein